MDPSLIWALKLKQTVEEGLVPCRNILREMKNQVSQTEIMAYFHEVSLSVPAPPPPPHLPPSPTSASRDSKTSFPSSSFSSAYST